MNSSVRSKVACEIAGLDPQRLNEAIHAGHLMRLPETTAGSARLFRRDDIVTLLIYANLLRVFGNQKVAGQWADLLNGVFREQEHIEFASMCFDRGGTIYPMNDTAETLVSPQTGLPLWTLKELDERAAFVKVLGSYPVAAL